MAEVIIIQNIKTVWTKKSRGGKLASLRNGVPEAVALHPEEINRGGKFIFHSLVYHESDGFRKPVIDSTADVSGERFESGGVTVEFAAGQLVVKYEYNYKCGAPARFGPGGIPHHKTFQLNLNEFGRVLYNGRFSDEYWWYEKQVFNIGRFDKPQANVFTASKPLHLIDDIAALW